MIDPRCDLVSRILTDIVAQLQVGAAPEQAWVDASRVLAQKPSELCEVVFTPLLGLTCELQRGSDFLLRWRLVGVDIIRAEVGFEFRTVEASLDVFFARDLLSEDVLDGQLSRLPIQQSRCQFCNRRV